MSVESKVPAIRFKEFSGQWEEKAFSELVNRLTCMSDSFELPRIEYEDIVSGKGVLNKDIYRKESNKVGVEFDVGDVLFGKLRPYLKNWFYPKFKGLAVGDFWVLRSRNDCGKFIYYLIQTKAYDEVANQSTGTKMPRSDWGFVSSTAFNSPESPEEQNQIGNIFQQLDTLIAKHQQKYDKLQNIKKALLEKMFPQQGQTTPAIRFKGFSDEWEENELGEVADITTGYPFDSDDFDDDGQYLVITNGNIQNNLDTIDASIGNRINIDESSHINSYILELGDVVVTMDGTVGRSAKVTSRNQILAQRVGRLSAKSNYEFLYQLLNEGSFIIKMSELAVGGTIKHISLNEIYKYVSLFPKQTEQTKIGNFFLQLDTLVNQHSSQLTKLNNIKQSLLNKMFV